MGISAYRCKASARAALNGNWQTALLVTFFSGALSIVYNLARTEIPIDLHYLSMRNLPVMIETALRAVRMSTWVLAGIFLLLDFLFTPVLQLGCANYFLNRMQGCELGFRNGLFSRRHLWGKAFLLHLYTSLKIFAWALLFIIPGIIAAIRYSQATYYLAQDPSLTVVEAVKKSKDAMKFRKWDYFRLELSFLGLSLLIAFFELLLAGMSGILSVVASMLAVCFLGAYSNGAFAAFFLTNTSQFAQDFSSHK